MNKLQKKVFETFRKNFGRTPLKHRLRDISSEAWELVKSPDMENMQEEWGDLLCSLLAGASENGWDVVELINNSVNKINKRGLQYSTLGRKTTVALFGGSFDPIHFGHLDFAKFVLNYSGVIDEVWLTPCFKSLYGKQLTDAKHRLAMCKLAAKADGRIKVFEYEVEHKLQGSTYYFLNKLLNEKSKFNDYKFYSLIGLDTAQKLPAWPNADYVMNALPFVIIARPGYSIGLKDAWFLKRPDNIYIEPDSGAHWEASSTAIRTIMQTDITKYIGLVKDKLKVLTPDDIVEYILKNQLYRGK